MLKMKIKIKARTPYTLGKYPKLSHTHNPCLFVVFFLDNAVVPEVCLIVVLMLNYIQDT